MKTYLVGGAVRDQLLGRPVKERDWVVVGATEKQMRDLGYKSVGKDFPVFLHPDTHEEYALARTERKTGKGYRGFECHADINVTLEQDLMRRDLTINAIAQDDQQNLIDPYHGQADIQAKYLRHVSPAFNEDPVRILRIARFAATLADFNVHPDTLKRMQDMVDAGEVDALVPERIWKEISRSFAAHAPARAMQVLFDSGAWPRLWPLKIDDFKPLQTVLENVTDRLTAADERFAAWCTPLDRNTLETFCQHCRAPQSWTKLALHCRNAWQSWQQALPTESDKRAAALLQCLEQNDAMRRPERFAQILHVCNALQANTTRTTALNNALLAITQLNHQQIIADCRQAQKTHDIDVKMCIHKARLQGIERTL